MKNRRAVLLSSAVVALQAISLVATAMGDRRLAATGRGDVIVAVYDPQSWALLAGVLVASALGWVVANRQPRHPVGWLFLALSSSVVATALFDEWYAFSAVGAGSLPGGDLAAALGDRSFIPWFTLVSLALLLTPTGTYLSARWRRVGHAAILAAVLGAACSLVGDRPLRGYPGARNPFTIAALNPAARLAGRALIIMVGACLVASGVSLVLRFRRAVGDERRQLLWLALAVVPLPALVVVNFVVVRRDIEWLTMLTAAAFVTMIPLAAALSVLRYRLYDVERVVVASLTYALLSSALVAIYSGLVWAGARLGSGLAPSPVAAATVGALAAAVLAGPLRRGLQDRLDRRFNRREHDARRVVAAALAAEEAGVDIESLLRAASGDAALVVAFPGPGDSWLSSAGTPAAPSTASIEITRKDRVVARIGFDPERTEEATLRRLAGLVAPELDNTRLRSELAAKVEEVEESRLRIAQAQRDERRRIERDLHDGAQQALLALAYRLQAAGLGHDPEQMRTALQAGAADAGAAARELRALANGLHPQALVEGGLSAVIDDLARRSPVPITVTAEVARLEPGVEFAAWLVIAEAVVNAQKHADADLITIDLRHDDELLRFRIADNGRGGADPTSNGLRGLVDRVEAARGHVTIRSGRQGTAIEGALPCAS